MADRVRVVRGVTVPDPRRVELYRRAPDLGPRLLFFSGGSALREVSRTLTEYTHNSIHIVTPFDSGGSSAVLRRAFGMLAVGDMRNRILALADHSTRGNPEVVALMSHRLGGGPARELEAVVKGQHPLVAVIPHPLRKLARIHLEIFLRHMPEDFDLSGASLGNLMLAGGFLDYGRRIDPVLYLFGKLVESRGTVRPVVSADLHLAAETEDGRVLLGQHRITAAPAAIRRLRLVTEEGHPPDRVVAIRQKTRDLIASADLICFPVGSFYTSLVANLLPEGVAASLADSAAPKVFIPNPGPDPESAGLSVAQRLDILTSYLGGTERLLNFVLLDRSLAQAVPEVEALGVVPLVLDLVRDDGQLDPEKTVAALLSLA